MIAELLRRAFTDVDDGFYIDVGACMPTKDSNTYDLYQKGWSGLIVEPLLALVPVLVENWQTYRPRDRLVAGMAAEGCGERPFYVATDYVQMSTGAIDRYRNQGAVIGEPTAQIKCYSLDALLSDTPMSKPIHLLSVDVEGMENAVMAGIDLEHRRPWIIVIETALDAHINDTRRKIETSGYTFALNDRANDWYVADERNVTHRRLTC